jgi:hypothetical protein
MKLKISATDATNIEVDVTTTIANGWEELSYDFATLTMQIIIKEL